MRRLLAAAALLLLSGGPASAESMSIEGYLAVRQGERSDVSADDLNRYLSGVLDGVISYDSLMQERGSPLFCLPEDPISRISIDNLTAALDEMFAQFERELPDFDDAAKQNSLGLAAIQLFVLRFPCGEDGGG